MWHQEIVLQSPFIVGGSGHHTGKVLFQKPPTTMEGFFYAQNMADLTFTTIEEPARKELDISRDEYAICNYVQTWSTHPSNKRPGFCDRTKGQMAEFIGISPRGIMKMLDKMERIGLIERFSKTLFLHRITQKWFDTVTVAKHSRKGEQSSSLGENKVPVKGEQSSSLGENKVPVKGEQSSSLGENKVPPHKEYNKEPKERGKTSLSQTLKVEISDPEIPGVKVVDFIEPTIQLGHRPNAKTPLQIEEAMREFYNQYPNEWKFGILENGKGRKYSKERRVEIVKDFCCYAITKNWGGDTYGQLNAALQSWFRSEQFATWKNPENKGSNAPKSDAVYEPPQIPVRQK